MAVGTSVDSSEGLVTVTGVLVVNPEPIIDVSERLVAVTSAVVDVPGFAVGSVVLASTVVWLVVSVIGGVDEVCKSTELADSDEVLSALTIAAVVVEAMFLDRDNISEKHLK